MLRRRGRGRRPPPPASQAAAQTRRASAGGGAERGPGALAGALSRALCFIHKVQRPPPGAAAGAGAAALRQAPKPRVLVLAGCPDVTSQYIAVMNAIFSALVRVLGVGQGLRVGVGGPNPDAARAVGEGVLHDMRPRGCCAAPSRLLWRRRL